MKQMLVVLFVALTALSLSLAASAQVIIPEAWGGIWLLDGEERDCNTNELLDSWTADPDTLCPGLLLEEGPDGEFMDCTGNVDDTNADVSCSGWADGAGEGGSVVGASAS